MKIKIRYLKPFSTDNIYSNEQNQYKCDIVTIDGRILTAAPLHLLIKTVSTDEEGEDEIIKDLYHNQMHKLSNYGSEESGGNFTEKGKVNNIAYDNKQYKYMDVVVLSKSGYQYVVPFLVVDVKWLHNNGKNHFAHLTDNTYGHVYENIEHEFDHMNPIEPYLRLEINGEENNQNGGELDNNILGEINEILKNYLFGSDKIVSMRLYDKQYDETEPNWWKEMRDRMQNYTDNYNNLRKSKPHNGIVVKYE